MNAPVKVPSNDQVRAVLEAAHQIWGFLDTIKIDHASITSIREIIDKTNSVLTSTNALHERLSTGEILKRWREKFRDYDSRKDKYVCSNNCTDLNPHLAVEFFLERAMWAGLDASKIDTSVWSCLVTSHLVNEVLYKRIHQLLELGVLVPPDSQIVIGHRSMSLHFHLARITFWKPKTFRLLMGQLTNFKFSPDVRRRMISELGNHWSEPNLDLLFQVGFTKEELCKSDLFKTIVWAGSELLYDWIVKDVGAPIVKKLLERTIFIDCLLLSVPHGYYKWVMSYLMTCQSLLVTREALMRSRSLIRESVRRDIFTLDEWLELAEVKGLAFAKTIRQALHDDLVSSS